MIKTWDKRKLKNTVPKSIFKLVFFSDWEGRKDDILTQTRSYPLPSYGRFADEEWKSGYAERGNGGQNVVSICGTDSSACWGAGCINLSTAGPQFIPGESLSVYLVWHLAWLSGSTGWPPSQNRRRTRQPSFPPAAGVSTCAGESYQDGELAQHNNVQEATGGNKIRPVASGDRT